jgi:hypothetical protein
MERILFGDNHPISANHMSEKRPASRPIRDLQAVIDVLDIVYEEGIRVFMYDTRSDVGYMRFASISRATPALSFIHVCHMPTSMRTP